jgi:hypothetical protein
MELKVGELEVNMKTTTLLVWYRVLRFLGGLNLRTLREVLKHRGVSLFCFIDHMLCDLYTFKPCTFARFRIKNRELN